MTTHTCACPTHISPNSSLTRMHTHTGAFDLGTALLFNNVDPQRAVKLWQQLAEQKQCVDAHVALGITFIEGIGVDADVPTVLPKPETLNTFLSSWCMQIEGIGVHVPTI